MNPKAIIEAIRPIVARCRTTDFWSRVKGSAPVRRGTALREEQLLRHSNGIVSIGLCPLEQGSSTVRVALLDMDSHKGDVPWAEMVGHAQRLALAANTIYGIELIPFRSTGGSGIHLIAVWDDPQDAWSVRTVLREILSVGGFTDGAGGVGRGQIEVFPKQNSVDDDGFGSMFIIPGSGESAPLDPELFITVDWPDVSYPSSEPVPYVEPPPVAELVELSEQPADIERIRGALAAIDPDGLDYGGTGGQVGWLEILFAVHAATGGSPIGRSLIVEWSQRWAGWDPVASATETDKQWRFARVKPGGIGPGTLFAEARRHGWVDPAAVAEAANPTGFMVLPPPTEPTDGPSVIADSEGGLGGMALALADSGSVGCGLRLDTFLDTILIQWGTQTPRRLRDTDTTKIRIRLENLGFAKPSVDDTRAVIKLAAELRGVDGAIDWLESLPAWDGVPRVDRFFTSYMHTRDDAYASAVGGYLWTAMAARVMDPGCKIDMVPVLVGKQGLRKSSAIAAMAPDREMFVELRLDNHDDANARLLRGKLLVELAELQGIRGREVESVKAWITRQYEEWIPKYGEHATRVPRRCVLIGSTNDRGFLSDPTGNRRFLPIDIEGFTDVDAIERDRDQLWAEGLARWRAHGVEFARAEQLAANVLEQYMENDEWQEPIKQYLLDKGPSTVRSIAVEVFGFDLKQLNPAITRRIGRCLRGCGAVESRRWIDKTSTKVWSLPARTIADIL